MVVVLMVAEKPSLAESLAKILSNGRYKSRKGTNGACSVHEYRGPFLGYNDAFFKFTSVCGHVMSVDFPGKYNNWDKVEPVELFDAPIIKKEANPQLNMPKFLANEARNATHLVLWLDCDKEGENICFEVIQSVETVMRISFDSPQNVFRAKFSAITDKDIKHAMRNLTYPNHLESISVDARQELDLRIGCAFTRFQTHFFHGKYGNLDSALISFGPCQTPTLGFCVDRHDKIQSFQPEPYWVLMVNVGIPGGPNLQLDWDKGREFNQNTAKSIMNKVKSSKKAVITHITKKDKVKARVGALNTVEMLRVASSGLAIGPHQAMSIAERLYTQGFISYPRTETNQYPANFDLVGTLRVFRSHEDYGSAVDLVLNKGVVRPKSGHDAGDHPPITPMKTASMNTFSDRDSWRLYDYIVRHFIGSLSGDCKYEQTTVHLLIGDEKFSKTGCIVLDPGFTEVMPWLAMANDERLPASIKTGDEFLIGETRLDERLTSPPDYLSESDLISLMEKHGIGTDASIPTHINNICVRNYVKISSGRRLIPTKLGIVLIHGYQKIDNHLVLPTRRAEIEKRLNQIAAGTADFHQVLSSTLAEFRTKFDNFVTNIAAMDELFEVSFSSLAESGKALSRCGKCRRYLKLITAKPVRLYCPNCQETLSLPHNGSFRTFKELKCPLDEYELLYFNGFGANSKSYVLCPNCYNNPPFEDMKKLSGCNQCSNKECPQSMIHLGIGDCRWCTWEGTLTLDPGSGHGGKWKIYCNKCDSFMTGLKEAVKVTVKNDKCSSCKSKTIHVEYKRERNPNESHGCVFCTPEVSQGLVSIPGKSARGRGGLTGQQNAGPGGHKVLGNRQIHQNNDPREGGDNFQRGGQQFNPQGGLDNGHFDGGRGGGGGFRGGRGKFNNRGGGRGGRGGDDDEDDDDGSGYGGRGGYSSGGRGGSRGGGRGGGRGGRGRGGGRGGRGRGRGRGGRDSDNDYAPTPSGSLRLSDFL